MIFKTSETGKINAHRQELSFVTFVTRKIIYYKTVLIFEIFKNSTRICKRINQIQMLKNLLKTLLVLLTFSIKDDLTASKKSWTIKEFSIERSNMTECKVFYIHTRNYQDISKKTECETLISDQAGCKASNQALQYKKTGCEVFHIWSSQAWSF